MNVPNKVEKEIESGVKTGNRLTRNLKLSDLLERYGLLLAWAMVIAIFGVIEPSTFLSGPIFASILGSQSVLVFLTFALLIPLTTGDYDLSAASVLTLSAMLVAVLNVQMHVSVGLAVIVALGAGVVIGLINGALIVLLGIESLIVTLGTGTILGGIVLWISKSNTISGISNSLVDNVIVPKVYGLPLGFFYSVALCVALWYFFEYIPLGRRLLFVGRGRRVSRLSGLNVGRIRWGAMVGSAVLSAAAGVLYAGTSGAADPTSGLTLLLPAFAAAFLGSTAITPGRFNAWGSIIAVYFLVTGITGLSLLGIEVFVQDLFYGGALVLAVALAQLARRREASDSEAGD